LVSYNFHLNHPFNVSILDDFMSFCRWITPSNHSTFNAIDNLIKVENKLKLAISRKKGAKCQPHCTKPLSWTSHYHNHIKKLCRWFVGSIFSYQLSNYSSIRIRPYPQLWMILTKRKMLIFITYEDNQIFFKVSNMLNSRFIYTFILHHHLLFSFLI